MVGSSVPQTGLSRFLTSESGAKFEPWQRQGAQSGLAFALGQLPSVSNAGNFDEVFKTVGGTPHPFTDIPQSAYLSPQVLSEMTNSMFAQGAARTGMQQDQIRQGTPPGMTSRFGLAEQLAGAQRANDAIAQQNATTLSGQYAPTINRLAAEAQTNVETQRNADDRQRRALALARMRDALQQQHGLLAAIGQFTEPLPFSQQWAPKYKVGFGGHQGFRVG